MIRNFHQVSNDLFRSGKYNANELKQISSINEIKQVIDLRDKDQLFIDKTYSKIGVKFYHVPINEYQKISHKILDDIINLALSKSTLIHCWKGSHRTGIVCAYYRINVQNWSFLLAWEEMFKYGFGEINKHFSLLESVFGNWRPDGSSPL